jgi:hypothetical protein
MQKALFTIDDEIIVHGIHNPEIRWNGWATPLLTLESTIMVAEWLESIGAEVENGGIPVVVDGVPFWKALDEMTETTIETLPIAPQKIDGVNYYDIGSRGWCWDEYIAPCEACRLIREEDSDLSFEEARTANLCGDCEAYYGLGA